MTIGLRKNGRYNHLCKLLIKNNISFDITEIIKLSSGQMKRRIEELESPNENKKNCWENRGKMNDMF